MVTLDDDEDSTAAAAAGADTPRFSFSTADTAGIDKTSDIVVTTAVIPFVHDTFMISYTEPKQRERAGIVERTSLVFD